MKNDFKLQQIKKYGNDYTTENNIRKFRAYDVLERKYKGDWNFKVEHIKVNEYHLRQWGYNWYGLENGKKHQAVYFLYDKGELVYIGQTVRENPYRRPIEHLTCTRKPKVYDSIKIMLIPDDVCIDTLESELIIQKRPKYNDTWKGIPVQRKRLKAIKKVRNQFNIKIN
jgi:hypothetical protein